MVNPAEIDDTEQAIARVRRFRSSHLDRLHKNGRLSWRQFYAGDWYRNLHHRGRFGLQVVASYGERTTGGERSEEHTSELQSLMRISYAVFCLKKKKKQYNIPHEQ